MLIGGEDDEWMYVCSQISNLHEVIDLVKVFAKLTASVPRYFYYWVYHIRCSHKSTRLTNIVSYAYFSPHAVVKLIK